ncbi:hypothetical protein J8I87_14885 [Paraburkholderia sp. LEh10]|uniref:hypothetical protein n=1 Tax=Paraburkholderia sp. LEh10 TaxID=2821353 RepID=UPI001AEA3017|nr:hypothetical protein [Paraburkholderia sp. LEh10]MBP0590973.1 hypothetical protein [Paraburkholderia sp. LEh10]
MTTQISLASSGVALMSIISIVGTIAILGVLAMSVAAILEVLIGNGRRPRARQRRENRAERGRERNPVAHVKNHTSD